MTVSLTRFYNPTTFKPGQLQNAFRKLPGILKVNEKKCSITIHLNYANGIEQNKDIDWKDLDTICEINSDSVSCLSFSYFPPIGGSFIIYIQSRCRGELLIHSNSPDIDTTNKLISIIENELTLNPVKDKASESITHNSEKNNVYLIENICTRFHMVVRQLLSRHSNRKALIIEDEYDTQDFLHALLHINFDDIRPEEWTPSYAGGSSRVDFLLKEQKIIIEVKKTRKTLKAKQIGDELLIDIQRYRVHPDCKILICFVYDPEGMISNPKGLENDLNIENDGFIVKVIIAPKGY